MAKRTTILKVSGLRRAFGPNTIFDKFSLEVRTGEAIALTGRNGAGKSTLLRCLVGADRPDDGSVQVCGNAMSEASPEIRRDVATVIDDLDFFPDLSVVEHLDLLARAHGIADPDDVVDEVLEEVQLVPQSGQLPGTLSSGQRRRLALATAFVRPRKLLILDEPEQRLDSEGLTWLAQRLKSERQKGLAIVFASHEPELVETRGHSGDPARSAPRMSSLEAGADDFAYHQTPEPQALTPASPRELKRLIKDWRAGRATRNVLQAMSDAYVAVFAAVMLGAMVVNVILKAQRTVAQCTSESCPVGPDHPAVGCVRGYRRDRVGGQPAVRAGTGVGSRRVLAARRADLACPTAPLSPGRRRVAAFLGGAVVGGLVSALTGSGTVEVMVWAAATALSAAASVAFAAAQQGVDRHVLTRVATYIFGLLGVGALFSVVGVAAGWFSLGLSDNLGIELGVIMIAGSGLVLAVSGGTGRPPVGQIRRARLLSGGALVSGISGAFFALDIGLARDIVVERRAIERGHVNPKRGKGLGLEAIIWREWQRLWRFPQPLLVLAGTIVVPYAATRWA